MQLSTAAEPSLCVNAPTRIQVPVLFRETFNPLAGVHAAGGLIGVDQAACAGVAAATPMPSAIRVVDSEATLLPLRRN